MTVSSIYVDNREVPLGKRIGKGGEGEVYAAAGHNGVAIKLYTVADKASREQKVNAMIRADLARKSPLTAFPISLARYQSGEFAGFTMRLVPDHRPLYDIYAPGPRKNNFPHADFRFLVHTATNVARAIASVHHAGCVIGDINHSSILISKKATVALIDADSFQVSEGQRIFGCLVGVDQYTPPELQGVKLSGVIRTPNHDAFGLAIVIFLLLFMGRHPFSGSPRRGDPPSFEEAIRDFRFVYSILRDVEMDKPPGTPALSDYPTSIARAFEYAFCKERAATRPTAMEWVGLLDALEKSLVQCGKNRLHWHAREASACPWCEMEDRLGTVLFLPYIPDARLITQPIDLGEGGFNIKLVWMRISQAADTVSTIALEPRIAAVNATPSAELVSTTKRLSLEFWARVVAVAVAAVILFAAPALWVLWIPLSVYAIFAGRGQLRRSVDPVPYIKHYVEVERRWHQELARWRSRFGGNDVASLRASLEAAKREYESLPAEEKRRMVGYQTVRRVRQLHDFLEGHLLANAKIKGIGTAKLATLSSFGIDSAAELSAQRLQGVPGFGPVNSGALLSWRGKIEARFVYLERPTPTDSQELARINQELQAKGAQLRKILIPGAENLSRLAARLKAATEMDDPGLNRIYQELEQAKCNLAFLKQPLPAASGPPQPPASPLGHSPGPVPQVPPSPTCPLCGAGMVSRVAQKGFRRGSQFWGCSRYPNCRGTRN